MICLLAVPTRTLSQTQTPPQDQSDVVRVFTDLVQTDVMVFDKQGHFKDDLRREDFELRIDGKSKPIEFFERIRAGSINEEAQLAAARGTTNAPIKSNPVGAVPLDRGRAVFFYVDDLHLDLAGAGATRKVITSFINADLGQNDEAAITSASGQIGFLQQLTDNKQVLRAALERIKPLPYNVQDMQRPTMSEYQALSIDNLDRDTTDFFVEGVLRDNPGMTRQTAENIVRGRATAMLQQSAAITRNSLIGLESLVRSLSKVPGRKLIFFLSNGFFINNRNSDAHDRVQKITSAAARSGVVIYSMDARGLVASLTDASTDAPFDPSGRLLRAGGGELVATQDGMNALARDTGGRAVFNTNDLRPGLKNALKETSVYYLLAWKPEQQDNQSSRKFRRIEVKLLGKPDLSVRVRRGFYDTEPPGSAAAASAGTKRSGGKKPETKLWEVIGASMPDRGIPFSLSLLYTNTLEKGGLLSSAVQIPNEFLTFTPINGKQQCVIEVAGGIYNERGQIGARFGERITLSAPPPGATGLQKDFVYGFPLFLPPGLYQARVGVLDVTSGKAGSANAWVDVPKMTPGEVALSSLHLGERDPTILTNASATTAVSDSVGLSIDHRFHLASYLRFLVFVYDAAISASDAKPDVALQVQLIRDNQPVVTTALKKVNTEDAKDLTRLPYAAEISLANLPIGRYILKVTVVDRVSKRSATQETPIEIE
ncbi:MAG: VWA domain-containing protein [Acidobacteriota bacterium]